MLCLRSQLASSSACAESEAKYLFSMLNEAGFAQSKDAKTHENNVAAAFVANNRIEPRVPYGRMQGVSL